MMIVTVTQVKRKLRTFVHWVVALLAIGLLLPQIYNAVYSYSAEVPKEERPSGQPMRVEKMEDNGVLSQFVIKWKELTK